MSTERRTRGVWSTPRPLGPNGEKLCYNCRGPLPKGRPYNCSAACSDAWRAKTSPSYMRFLMFQRDRGVCALCHVDTVALQREYRDLVTVTTFKSGRSQAFPDPKARASFLAAHGIPWGRVSTDWWDADHIKAVVEGGGECDLSNLRTLCIPCHRSVTADLAERRAWQRRHPRGVYSKPAEQVTLWGSELSPA